MTGGIVWIASYPKSGNTWVRVFVDNLLSDGDTPADINDLKRIRGSFGRSIFDDALGIETSDLTADEVDRLRPLVYAHIGATAEKTPMLKTHEDWAALSAAEASSKALYLVRNPLDVAVSYANHGGTSIQQAVEFMHDEKHTLAGNPGKTIPQERQILRSWSTNVSGWLDQTDIPVLVMRYEDMLDDPVPAFTRIAQFLDLPTDENRVLKALELSRIDVLQRQEDEHGFKEKAQECPRFFRKGRSGDWREQLTPQQARAIVDRHGPVMRRLGYDDALQEALAMTANAAPHHTAEQEELTT